GGWSPDQTYFNYLDGIQVDWSRANFLDATSRRVKDLTEAKTFCESYCNEPIDNNGRNCEDLQAGQNYICNLKVPRSQIFGSNADSADIRLALSKNFNLVGELDIDSYRDETSFRAFVRETADYFDEIKYWEIGNEVDARFNGSTYGPRVKMAYEEIKSVCPDCKVGISTVGNDPTILPKPGSGKETGIKDIADTLFSNFCGYFDFIDAHLLDMTTENRLKELKGRVASWNQLAIDNNCEPKELISTETNVADTGWPLGENSRDGQARGIIKLYAIVFEAGYNKIFYRTMFDDPLFEGPDAVWAHDGLITKHPENEIKPAFYAFKTLTEKIGGFTSVTKLTDTQYKFIVNGKNVYVLWCASGSCSLPSEISGTVKVTDYLGNEETKNTNEIVLNESPIFVEGATEIPPSITNFEVNQSGNDLSVYVSATDSVGIEKINLNSPITDEYSCNGEIICEHVFNVNLGSLNSSLITGNAISKSEKKCGDGVCDSIEKEKNICKIDCIDENHLEKDCMYQCVKVNGKILAECSKKCNAKPPVIQKLKGKQILKYQGIDVSSKENIEIKDKKIIMQTKQGSKEIKIMPDTAQNAALKKIFMRESKIELKEKSGKPVYELQGKRKAKLFGFIPIEKKVTVEVDANTAEVISTSQSWWAFLSTDAEGVVNVSVSVTNMNGLTTTETKTCPGDCTTTINTYYVSKQGNDNNDGSEQNPWLTIQKAADSLEPGNIVYVKEGTYNEDVIIETSGTADKRITFSAYNNDKVNIVAKMCHTFYVKADYITIKGFNISGASFYNPENNGVECADWLRAGIMTHRSYNIFENNEISNSNSNSIYGDGIVLRARSGEGGSGELGPPSDGYNIIRNNYIHDTFESGVRVKKTNYNTIINNRFYYNSLGNNFFNTYPFEKDSIFYTGGSVFFYCLKNLTIVSNTFYEPKYGAIIGEWDVTTRTAKGPSAPPGQGTENCPITVNDVIIKNNIGYKTGSYPTILTLGRDFALGSGNVIDNNVWYNGNPGSKMIEWGYNWWHDNDEDDGVIPQVWTLKEFQENTGYDINSKDTEPPPIELTCGDNVCNNNETCS
ncbi:MAG: right-handed parallel beta-helix repeat-containing protein, partial [Nanoarchaeota archaeon]